MNNPRPSKRQTAIQKNDEHMDSFLRALAKVEAFKQTQKNKDKSK